MIVADSATGRRSKVVTNTSKSSGHIFPWCPGQKHSNTCQMWKFIQTNLPWTWWMSFRNTLKHLKWSFPTAAKTWTRAFISHQTSITWSDYYQIDLELLKWMGIDNFEMQHLEFKIPELRTLKFAELWQTLEKECLDKSAVIFKCWTSLSETFISLKKVVFALLSGLGSTYTYEQIFSHMKVILSPQRTCTFQSLLLVYINQKNRDSYYTKDWFVYLIMVCSKSCGSDTNIFLIYTWVSFLT